MSQDLYCQHCNEPWDVYTVHHELDPDRPTAKADFMAGVGCPACYWGTDGEPADTFKSLAMGMMADLLGDDLDGMASMLDDWDHFHGLD